MQDSEGSSPAAPEAKLTLSLLFTAFWRARALFVVGVVLGLIFAMFYLTFYAQPAYRATASIGPAPSHGQSSNPMLAMYGLDMGEGGGSFGKFMEVMVSVRAADNLQRKYGVMQHIFGGWDPVTQNWLPSQKFSERIVRSVKAAIGLPGWQPPTSTTLSQFLRRTISVVPIVQTDVIRSGLYKISFTWGDREYAVHFLSILLQETDQLVRQDQLVNTDNRINYLKEQINRTQEIVLRDSLQRLLQSEEQSRMTLQADHYYAVDVIDPPDADLSPVSPRSSLILGESVAAGFLTAGLLVFFLLWRRIEGGKDPLNPPLFDPMRPFVRNRHGRNSSLVKNT